MFFIAVGDEIAKLNLASLFSMPLFIYRKKRDFKRTAEPKGRIEKTGKSRFVVQRHDASHLHFDFRLEENGVLKSWAVPKGLPEKAGEKRLAVQVEDHPISYIDFEGKIPKGEYGAGFVKIWDKGIFKKISGSLENGRLKIELNGRRFKGIYFLIQTKLSGNKKNWLIFKK